MIISCPECNGKLSTAAPSCPHCGYEQKSGGLPPAPAAPLPVPGKSAAPHDLVPPSKEALRQASQRQWAEWNRDSFWPMAFGVMMVLAILGILAVTIYYLKRAGGGP